MNKIITKKYIIIRNSGIQIYKKKLVYRFLLNRYLWWRTSMKKDLKKKINKNKLIIYGINKIYKGRMVYKKILNRYLWWRTSMRRAMKKKINKIYRGIYEINKIYRGGVNKAIIKKYISLKKQIALIYINKIVYNKLTIKYIVLKKLYIKYHIKKKILLSIMYIIKKIAAIMKATFKILSVLLVGACVTLVILMLDENIQNDEETLASIWEAFWELVVWIWSYNVMEERIEEYKRKKKCCI